MRHSEIRSALPGIMHCLGITVVVLALLTPFPTLAESGSSAESSPPKPVFEVVSSALQDNLSGLMWTLNADIAGRTLSWEDAREYIARMNMDGYAGHKDWCLPSREDLKALIDHVKSQGFDGSTPERTVAAGFQGIGVNNAQQSYWSSTTDIYQSSKAWNVSMLDGSQDVGDKTLYHSLWPVRSCRSVQSNTTNAKSEKSEKSSEKTWR